MHSWKSITGHTWGLCYQDLPLYWDTASGGISRWPPSLLPLCSEGGSGFWSTFLPTPVMTLWPLHFQSWPTLTLFHTRNQVTPGESPALFLTSLLSNEVFVLRGRLPALEKHGRPFSIRCWVSASVQNKHLSKTRVCGSASLCPLPGLDPSSERERSSARALPRPRGLGVDLLLTHLDSGFI